MAVDVNTPRLPSGRSQSRNLEKVTATGALFTSMIVLGLVPVPTHYLFQAGLSALEVNSWRAVIAAIAALICLVFWAGAHGRNAFNACRFTYRGALYVGTAYAVSGYAYIESMHVGLHPAYALLIVAATAVIVARVFERDSKSDRWVFGLVVLLMVAALLIGGNVLTLNSGQTSIVGVFLAIISGTAFGLLPRSMEVATDAPRIPLLAGAFTISAILHVIAFMVVDGEPKLLAIWNNAGHPDIDFLVSMALVNGIALTFMPYALTAWAKNTGEVSDSLIGCSYQLEPASALAIASPLIAATTPLGVYISGTLVILGLICFALHEAQISNNS